jgi:hypothetical protein
MNRIGIVALVMLLNITGFAQVPSDTTLSIEIISGSKAPVPIPRIFSTTGYLGVVSNTQPDVLYEFQYKQNRTNWISLGFMPGPEIGTPMLIFNIPTNLVPPNSEIVSAKKFRARSWKDSSNGANGSMSDWWQIKYFGNIDVNGALNPMGDGWMTMFKFQKGMDPFKWYPPPGQGSQFPYSNPPHYPEPIPFAELIEATPKSIRNTILSVTAISQTNGYELTVHHPLIRARYLLLVRDKNDRQWRASGYFVSGTNRNPVYLHVDKKGMMTDTQSPITLPPVNFLPDVVQPEFTAGWGEDTDGDGLPDIYEVLVTHTDPNDDDTGDTGIPDGFRVTSNDGWNNWEKFRYRANPFIKYEPPPAIVLKKPTDAELLQAQILKTDLPYELQIEIRTNDSASFQPFSIFGNASYLNTDRTGRTRCDVRISWKVPQPQP